MTAIRLPQYPDYQLAVQHPALAFGQDPDLRICQVETNLTGPYSRGGGFAYTYRLEGAGKQWAVRCFKTLPDEARQRMICHFIETHPQPFFVPTRYLPQGVLVNGQWYPVIKMQWVRGQTLGTYMDQNVNNAPLLHELLTGFVRLVTALEGLGIAHGDLQNGNVMVQNRRLMLVDYDGMYIPELAAMGAKERGHPDYQHPARGQDFGPYLDRFSSIVIYLALKALIQAPELWDRYSSGENLLFRQRDFIAPDSSQLLSELEALPGFVPWIQTFRHICKTDLIRVPTLFDFLSGRVTEVLPERVVTIPGWGQYDVIAANQRARLLQLVGQRITVVGRISGYAPKQTQQGKPFAFLNFGDWRRGDFRLVIWSEGLQTFTAKGKDLRQYAGKWVSVTGLLSEYQKGSYPKSPQFIIETPAEIEILTGGEAEAKQRLSGQTSNKPVETQPPRPKSTVQTIPQPASIPAETYFEKGWFYHKQGNVNQAITQYQAALKVNPNFAAAHYNLGLLYKQQGQLEQALTAYQAAIQSNPNYIQAQQALALLYGEKGRLDKTIQIFQAILANDANFAEAHFGLGWAYGQQGRFDKAISAYKITLKLNPNHSTARYYLGWIHNQQGRLTEAIQELEIAAKLSPNDENIQKFLKTLHSELYTRKITRHCTIGLKFKSQQRWTEAIQAFSAALALNPRHSEAQLGLIESYLQTEQWVSAERQIEIARRLNIVGIDGLLSLWQPGISVSQSFCDFGELPLGKKAIQYITVSNTGKGFLHARITNILSWLKVSPLSFTCPPGIRQQIAITIPSDLCAGNFDNAKAFEIQHSGSSVPIGIHVKIIPPILAIEPEEVILLLNQDGVGEAKVTVTNIGVGELKAVVDPVHGFTPHQINITPTVALCSAGKSQVFKITMRCSPPYLQDKLPQVEICINSNGGKSAIKLKPLFSGPQLKITPTSLNLGTYLRGSAPYAQLQLQNTGQSDVQGEVRIVANKDWIKTKVNVFHLQPGESNNIILHIVADIVKLNFPELSKLLTAEIQVTSNGGNFSVPVKLISKYLGT